MRDRLFLYRANEGVFSLEFSDREVAETYSVPPRVDEKHFISFLGREDDAFNQLLIKHFPEGGYFLCDVFSLRKETLDADGNHEVISEEDWTEMSELLINVEMIFDLSTEPIEYYTDVEDDGIVGEE